MRVGLMWAALCVGALSSCGSTTSEVERAEPADSRPASGEPTAAAPVPEPADQSICRDDAKAVEAPYSDAFPMAWTFPVDTTVYDVEDRGSTGVIVTAVSSAPFGEILDFLNTDEEANGFKVTEGETEDNDAEASWEATDYTGRWTIQKSATCGGETVMQVLATPVV